MQWTTWVGGLRRGNADAGLSGVDIAPDGSLLLVGATTEFSEHTDWGYDGMAEKLSADGDVEWVTTVDREVFTAASHPGAVVAMDDGGLAWAATSHRDGTVHWDAFVIRMGPGGTAGKLGSYQTQVDIGNARLVRIEHPEITSQASTRDSQSVTCESEDADTDPQDTTLTGSDVEGEALSTLTLRPLYPADPRRRPPSCRAAPCIATTGYGRQWRSRDGGRVPLLRPIPEHGHDRDLRRERGDRLQLRRTALRRAAALRTARSASTGCA